MKYQLPLLCVLLILSLCLWLILCHFNYHYNDYHYTTHSATQSVKLKYASSSLGRLELGSLFIYSSEITVRKHWHTLVWGWIWAGPVLARPWSSRAEQPRRLVCFWLQQWLYSLPQGQVCKSLELRREQSVLFFRIGCQAASPCHIVLKFNFMNMSYQTYWRGGAVRAAEAEQGLFFSIFWILDICRYHPDLMLWLQMSVLHIFNLEKGHTNQSNKKINEISPPPSLPARPLRQQNDGLLGDFSQKWSIFLVFVEYFLWFFFF